MNKNILAIGAHPDDIEWGCAGALLRLIDKGHEIYFYIATQGESGGNPDTREVEQCYSAGVIGVKQVFWGGFKDRYIMCNYDIISSVEEAVQRVNPLYIFTHHPEDSHQDHRAVAQATLSAARLHPNILLYEGTSSLKFYPVVYVNIDRHLEIKLQLLEGFFSQAERNLRRTALTMAQARGLEAKVRYAEGFQAIRLFLNI